MNILILLSALFHTALSLTNHKNTIIQLKLFYNSGLNSVYLKGGIGTPLESIYFAIDISISYSFILKSNGNFNKSLSSSYQCSNDHRNYDASPSGKGIEFNETIEIGNVIISSYPFLEVDELLPLVYVPYLGFGKGPQSLPGILYQRGLIKQNVFQFLDSALIIGDSSSSEDNETEAFCNLNQSYSLYACHLKGVRVNLYPRGNPQSPIPTLTASQLIQMNIHVVFDSTYEDIIIPMEYFALFNETLLMKANIDKCKRTASAKSHIHYDCNETDLTISFSLHFLFDTFTMRFNYDDLIVKDNSYALLSRFVINFKENTSDITLGLRSLRKFHIGLSQEENKAFFYSKSNKMDNQIGKNETNEVMVNKALFYWLSIWINSIGLGFVICFRIVYSLKVL